MKTSLFTESQIINILRQAEVGHASAGAVPRGWDEFSLVPHTVAWMRRL